MKVVITFQDVAQINELVQAAGLPVVVHLRDACAGQSLWLEAPAASVTQISEAGKLLVDFFAPRHITANFFKDGYECVLKSNL